MSALLDHLQSGHTTVCRAWAISRSDGVTFGFTDHDLPLKFEGVEFKADSGLTARALVAGTGLSVDNSEAMGALSDASISESDIEAGRYDGAEVRMWLVNWSNLEERVLRFRGHIGELRRQGGAFHAELRGLTEGLNAPQGRVYQRPCSALLGDAACGKDLSGWEYQTDADVSAVTDARVLSFAALGGYEAGWFERGVLTVKTGDGTGQRGMIKRDTLEEDGTRIVELWDSLRGGIAMGDTVRLTAGCDKRSETCRLKFNNFKNFQGFPHVPGEDWLMRIPKQDGSNTGGSLQS